MKKFLLLLPLMALLSFDLVKTGLTKKEKRFAINYLTETRDYLVTTVNGLTDAQFNYKSSPDRWSIKECLQHIAAAEEGLWKACEGSLQAAAAPEKRSEIKVTDEDLIKRITDRSQKAKAPEMLQPDKSPYATPEAALKAFESNRNKLIKFMRQTKDDMRNHIWASPLGTMDTYQVVLLISAHSSRHTQQIIELKNDAGFPK